MTGHSLKHHIALHPWRWFFALALVPTLVISLPGEMEALDTVIFAVLAAMLVAWSCDDGAKAAKHRVGRVAAFVIVFAAYMLPLLWGGRVPGFYALLWHASLGAVTALALAAVFSPTASLRELVRPLLHWRAPWQAYVVAVAVWPLMGCLVIAARRQPSTGSSVGSESGFGLTQSFVLAALLTVLLTAIPTAVAWYGFAAPRLLGRLSPLMTALIVGPLPWLAVLLPVGAWDHYSSPFVPLFLLQQLALAIVAVWLYLRSKGSLLPVVLLFAVSNAVSTAVAIWLGAGRGPDYATTLALLTLEGLLALVLVMQGRMWRRPPPHEDADADLVGEVST